MPFLTLTLSESHRQRMLLCMVIFSCVSVFTSLGLLIVGAHIKLQVQEYVNIVDKDEGNAICIVLIATGLLSMANCIFGAKILTDCREIELRGRRKKFLLPYIASSLTLCILTLIAGIMCFAHVNSLHLSFRNGLTDAMQRYKSNLMLKAEIDRLQITYSCCGNKGYEDWFAISWVNENSINLESKGVEAYMGTGEFLQDNVPFSCCDPKSHRPCIHHNVQDNHKHYNYDYAAKTTLYTVGCKNALMMYFGDVLLVNAGRAVCSIFASMLCGVVGLRFLQTSIEEALLTGDAAATAPGYIIKASAKGAAGDGDREPSLEAGRISDDDGDMYESDFADAEESDREDRRLLEIANEPIYANVNEVELQ
ncbi:PREDICTED: photoreceptor outer segment membrane glycoprotein 2-like [Priapulus caudatus]|uniref:Photoreceptor outer segment membrane glycoprotein 2-like n=1 Tax=Priapulus caudatus TaxID=37621 RepID=A0ABM1ETB8_PRICU|nr:PREDICTED: photoreceptor outer segment membrane glycoprotein 2-like [Priapulus caudatus]